MYQQHTNNNDMLLHALKREYFKKLEARCKKPAETKKKDKGKIKGKKKRHEGEGDIRET